MLITVIRSILRGPAHKTCCYTTRVLAADLVGKQWQVVVVVAADDDVVAGC